MITATLPETADNLCKQVDRILRSETFRNSEALQRLLRYLSKKAASGEAAQLKEYTIGTEGLGRSSSYNPSHDAAVRVQVGRLRQKLAEYYGSEGQDDPFVLTLPKGGFRLSLDPAFQMAAMHSEDSLPPVRETIPRQPISRTVMVRYAVAGCLALWAVIATWGFAADERRLARVTDQLTPALRELWHPFLASDRPLLIAIGDPLFIEMNGYALYRVPAQSDWQDEQNSARIGAIQKAVGAQTTRLSHRYANVAEVRATFMLGEFLAPYLRRHISLIRCSELSWTQLAGNNLLFIGGTMEISDRLKSLPTQLELSYERGGIQVRTPRNGEPAWFPEKSPAGSYEEGEAFALITHAPGPDAQGDVETFASSSAPSEVGAMQWYSDPERAAFLVSKLRGPGGHIPRYYQLLLKVKFKGGIPTETSWVMNRELKITAPSAR